jgi:GT2 family glycosyltransferase/glycosyltransferase involved in cell wall biosynthesis
VIEFKQHPNPLVSIIVVAWRQAPLLLTCLESVIENVVDVDYEMLLVLNEPSVALANQVEREVTGAQVMRFRSNLGFGGGVNYAASRASGKYLVLLNDDSEVERGWLESLIDTMTRRPQCGMVGSTFIHTDGTLQEAGSILWSDGHSSAVGDGGSVGFMAFERRVDYCSGGSLLIRKELWDQLGGFDDRYYPAYYEDLDLSLRAAEAGWQVWYQPASVVHHVRSASAGRLRLFLDGRSHSQFVERWEEKLKDYEPAGAIERGVWRAMGRPLRILVLDDHVPDPSIGAGYGRMHDTLQALTSDEGIHVDYYPTVGSKHTTPSLARMGVRIIGDLESHVTTDGVDYEVVIIARPNNFQNFYWLMRKHFPLARVIYDAESLFFRRLEAKVAFARDDDEREDIIREAEWARELEENIFASVDSVVCISEAEAEVVRRHTDRPVHIVEAWLTSPTPTSAPFEARRHIGLVAGWAAGAGSPNCEGLLWFAREVLPKVRAALPGCRLLVTGSRPPADVNWLEGRYVSFVGHVQDLSDFYNRVRVVISPTRYGAGVKLKTVEAIQYGVPVVATGEAVGGLSSTLLDAVWTSDDPDRFAEGVIALARDRDLWERYRTAELGHTDVAHSRDPHLRQWISIVRGTAYAANRVETN